MTSETRRQTTDDLCARIDAVVTGHDLQRSGEQYSSMRVDGSFEIIDETHNVQQFWANVPGGTNRGPVEIRGDGSPGNGRGVYTWTLDEPPHPDPPSLLTRVLRRLAELGR